MASLLRNNIQDFVQEVPIGQMAQGTPFRCLGEVKPPKNPARHWQIELILFIFDYNNDFGDDNQRI